MIERFRGKKEGKKIDYLRLNGYTSIQRRLLTSGTLLSLWRGKKVIPPYLWNSPNLSLPHLRKE